MGAYDSQIATAKRLIAAKGELCLWAASAPATAADPDQPWLTVAGAAPAPVEVRIVMLPASRQYRELLRFLKGTEVVGGGAYGLMAAVSFDPAKTGIVTRKNGTKLSIESIDLLAPNGDPILYTIEFAK